MPRRKAGRRIAARLAAFESGSSSSEDGGSSTPFTFKPPSFATGSPLLDSLGGGSSSKPDEADDCVANICDPYSLMAILSKLWDSSLTSDLTVVLRGNVDPSSAASEVAPQKTLRRTVTKKEKKKVPPMNGGKPMIKSDGAGHYLHYICDRCRASGSGIRWFDPDTKTDYCFSCEPEEGREKVVETQVEEVVEDAVARLGNHKDQYLLHRSVVANWSPVLGGRVASLGASDSLELDDYPPRLWDFVLRFFYTGEITINQSNVFPLLSLARAYELPEIIDCCNKYVEKGVNRRNCCALLDAALEHSMPHLETQCKANILKFYDSVSKTDDFLKLPVALLLELIASSELRSEGEHMVYSSLIRWVNHDVENRKEHVSTFLDRIRWFSMTPADLAGLPEPPCEQDAFHQFQVEAFKYDADESMVPHEKGDVRFVPRKGVFNQSKTFSVTGKIEEYEIKHTGVYKFTAKGAAGLDGTHKKGGKGAIITATFQLKRGAKLEILVGDMSTKSSSGDTGGGGGTFVSIDGRRNPLIVAGGGGGTRGASGDADGADASLTKDGTKGNGSHFGQGGKDGEGGKTASSSYGGGGAGYFGDCDSTKAFVNGGSGGSYGGFGCGGARGGNGGGGGGGYSGGGGGQGGGGGGSFVRDDGKDVSKEVGNEGKGELLIQYLD